MAGPPKQQKKSGEGQTKRKRLGSGYTILIVSIIFSGLFSLPTALMLIIGMLPTVGAMLSSSEDCGPTLNGTITVTIRKNARPSPKPPPARSASAQRPNATSPKAASKLSSGATSASRWSK